MRSYANELSMAKSQNLGGAGERHAAHLFEKLGYHVEMTGKLRHCGDLRVTKPETGETWRVEVKTSRRVKTSLTNYGWQFCLRKPGNTDCGYSDFVLLLAVRGSGDVVCFLIPTRELGQRKIIVINAKSPLEYRGMWSPWRVPVTSLTLST